MTAKTQSSQDRSNDASGKQQTWRGSLWVLAALILLSRTECWFSTLAPIVDTSGNETLAPDWAGRVLLGQLLHLLGIATDVPYWLFAALAAAVIGTLARRLEIGSGQLAGLSVAGAWALTCNGLDLIPAALCLVLVSIQPRLNSHPHRQLAIGCIWLIAAACSSLEFGLLWFFAFSWTCISNASSAARKHPLLTGFAIAAASGILLLPGMLPMAARPVSVFAVPALPELLDSIRPAFSQQRFLVNDLLLLGLLLFNWYRFTRIDRPTWTLGTVIMVVSALGLGCRYYLWLSTVFISLVVPTSNAREPVLESRVQRLIPLAACLIVLLRLAPLLPVATQDFLVGVNTSMTPADWPVRGPVMLADLDDSNDWRTGDLPRQYRLLVSDRWDVFSPVYVQYASVLRDVSEMRVDSFLDTTDNWRGYKLTLEDWSPVLFVESVTALQTIRRISLNPDWTLLGIDGRRVIFGSAGASGVTRVGQIAGSTIAQLEWPGLSGTPINENVIVVQHPADYRRAAAALAAMRLPFAGLRVLRTGSPDAGHNAQALCYIELAHRSVRYTGTVSLLDQTRAASSIDSLTAQTAGDPEMALRLARACEVLGWNERATRLAIFARSNWLSGRLTQPQHSEQQRLLQLSKSKPKGKTAQTKNDSAETQMRKALTRGDFAAASELLASLPANVRPFYEVLSAARVATPESLLTGLRSLIDQGALPEPRQAEAMFYAGCLANEIGDPATAAQMLAASAKLHPESPFAPLRGLYLRQISQH